MFDTLLACCLHSSTHNLLDACTKITRSMFFHACRSGNSPTCAPTKMQNRMVWLTNSHISGPGINQGWFRYIGHGFGFGGWGFRV